VGTTAWTWVGDAVMVAMAIALVWMAVRVRQTLRDTARLRREAADTLAREREVASRTARESAMVEMANAEKTRFWAAASHDLKQPLHALGLYTALLRKDPPAAERQELLDHIGSCVGSLTDLFDAILGVTHAETAHLHARPSRVALQPIIDKVLVQLRPAAEAKGLRLRAARTHALLHADAAIVERILGNLVSNAIRYTERGQVLVGVRRRAGHAVLTVIDTGIGMAANEQARIFEDFFQAHNPERQRDKGYGLGLSTVHRLCAALHYRIEVHSQPGHGSRFAVSFPLDSGTSLTESQEPVHTLDGDLHVLFVEDDPLVRDAMNRMLKDWGVHVSMCACGDEALSILSQALDRRWHVLLDQQLADNETGLQVADRIRTIIGEEPTITLVTGEVDPAVDLGAAERGIEVLRKPLKPIRLRALLQARQTAEVA